MKATTDFKITVITINYNNLKGLQRTIPSVLSQSYTNYEYIVIDGGSTDGSKEYIESQQQAISYWVSEKDKGVYNAMNKAIHSAHGEYCIFMNSGDHFFATQSLEKAAAELDGTDYCTGKTIIMEEENLFLCTPPQTMTFRFAKDRVLQHQSTFIKTQLLKDQPYDENLRIVSDWAHFFESWCLKKCSYKALNTIVSVYYTDGLSSVNKQLLKEERKEVLAHLLSNRKDLPKDEESKEAKRERIDEDFAFKMRRATEMKPIARDWKAIRNGFKFLWKDLFL